MSDSETKATLDVIRRFNEAFNRHDVDGVMALMTAEVDAANREMVEACRRGRFRSRAVSHRPGCVP